jgi:hypothetical protein
MVSIIFFLTKYCCSSIPEVPSIVVNPRPAHRLVLFNYPTKDRELRIGSFTYLLLFKDLSNNPGLDQTKAKSLVDFISFTDGSLTRAKPRICPTACRSGKECPRYLKIITFKGTPLYTGQ